MAEPAKKARFGEWADAWLETLTLKPSTVASYLPGHDQSGTAVHGHKRVRSITHRDIIALNRAMAEKGVSETTRHKHLCRNLRAAFAAAVIDGEASQNPVMRVPANQRPSVAHKERPYFTDQELARLLNGFTDPMFRTAVHLAVHTGMREGEVIGLLWNDVDLERGEFHVRHSIHNGHFGTTKNRDERTNCCVDGSVTP